jgi:hypothetical protein
VGAPVATTDDKRVWLELTYFYGLGALIIFLGAVALGRLSVRTARDIAHVQRPVASAATPQPATATPQPAPSEEVTEIQPTASAERAHRPWAGMFGRRHTHAH